MVLILILLFVSLQPTIQYFKKIIVHNCENFHDDFKVSEKLKYGYTGDIQENPETVNAHCEERRCACVGTYRNA